MNEYKIKSRKDLKAYKSNVLKEIRTSGKNLKADLIIDFSPKIQTPSGSRWDYGKLVNYAVYIYKGVVWGRKFTSFFKSNKQKKRRR